MKIISQKYLEGQQIEWVKPGQSVPMMQGMALNKLNKEYPTKREQRSGWFLFQSRDYDTLDQACYYLIERMVNLVDGVKKCLVAFKENGDSLEGFAIFTPEEENKPEYGKQYALTGATGDKCLSNGNTWQESEIK